LLNVNQLRTFLWHIDPGYFNLKQAVKTILAILLVLWWVGDEDIVTIVIAGVISGASMQGVVAKSLAMRMAHIVIFDAIYFLALALGFSARGSPRWTAILLVVWGFCVNYIRRFGLDNSLAPMMAWTLCFIATIAPLAGFTQMGELVYGVFVGFIASALVITAVFPENYPRLFLNNSNRFFQNLAQGLEEMRCYMLLPHGKATVVTMPFVSRYTTLEKLLTSNQAVQQSITFANAQKKISHILIHQYTLLNAYSLMIEFYNLLLTYHYQFPREALLALDYVSEEFICLFSTMKVHSDYTVSTDSPSFTLPNLAEKLGKESLTEPAIIMALLNLKLSFDLLNKHGSELLRGTDET